MSKIRILIVEDEVLIAEDIRESLNNSDYEVVGVVYDYEAALQQLDQSEPDFVLLDINLGNNTDGFKIAEVINERYHIPFVYLTSYASKTIVDQAKHTRPMGYIVKPFDEGDLFTSIEIAMFNYGQLVKPSTFCRDSINEQILSDLTPKEFEILTDMYDGKTNKQMSEAHFVSVNTIKTHIQKIYDKLDVHTRAAAIARIRKLLT